MNLLVSTEHQSQAKELADYVNHQEIIGTLGHITAVRPCECPAYDGDHPHTLYATVLKNGEPQVTERSRTEILSTLNRLMTAKRAAAEN